MFIFCCSLICIGALGEQALGYIAWLMDDHLEFKPKQQTANNRTKLHVWFRKTRAISTTASSRKVRVSPKPNKILAVTHRTSHPQRATFHSNSYHISGHGPSRCPY